jgi:predicted Zn-dependent protease
MRQRCRLAVSVAGILLAFASCQRVGQLEDTLRELQQVKKEVSGLVDTDEVSVNINNGRYLSIGITNSPLTNLPAAEKRQNALEIAKLAYASYASRAGLEIVVVAFVIHRSHFLFFNYSDARDSFEFRPVDLASRSATPSERRVPKEVPENNLYFVAIGEVPPVLLDEMVAHLHQKFGLSITVLSRLPFDRVTVDPLRSQIIADELIAAIRRRYASLVRDSRARVIGITAYDIYSEAMANRWTFTFSLRNSDDHVAVVSYARMNPANLGDPPNGELLRSRLRKMVTKNIGIMYYGLPLSPDSRSVLYGNILGVDELDQMSEDFDPK